MFSSNAAQGYQLCDYAHAETGLPHGDDERTRNCRYSAIADSPVP
jgi:hypothetical protein